MKTFHLHKHCLLLTLFSFLLPQANTAYSVSLDPVVQNELATLAPEDIGERRFGFSVAISGDTMVVGARALRETFGAAYVFVRSGTTWIQQDKLVASDQKVGKSFGVSVAISGDTIVVGAEGDDEKGPRTGAAYVFVRSGTTWTQQQKLFDSNPDEFDAFGRSVAVSGDTIVVGAPENRNGSNGSASVFVRNGATWTQQARLFASDGDERDIFGWSVAMSEDTVVIGAPFNDLEAEAAGSAYVFVRSGTTWTQQDKLIGKPLFSNWFGTSVAVSGDTILVGEGTGPSGLAPPRSAFVFVRTGTTWTRQDELVPSAGDSSNDSDDFGESVSLSGDTAVIGAIQATFGGITSGAAFVFVRSGTTWTQQAILLASDGADRDLFGTSVAVSRGTILVGAPFEPTSTFPSARMGTGLAYVFADRQTVNVNGYFPDLASEDVESTRLERDRICEPAFPAGTYTIRARFDNTSADTTLSNLIFQVKELRRGPILCNAEGGAGRAGATVAVARVGDYADGLLGPGEHFFQTFEIGLDEVAPFTLFVDLFGVIAIDETAPSLIQSNLGLEDNNLEVVVRGPDGQLHQYFRKKVSEDEFEWLEGSIPFAPGATSAPSLIQSTLPEGNNFRVVVRGADRKLHHYVREESAAGEFVWNFVEIIERAGDVTSAPSWIQSTLGPEENNLELVVRGSDGQLHQYFREKDDQGNFVWEEGSIPFAAGAASAPSLIQSNLGPDENNLEVAVRGADGQLHQYFREKDDEGNFTWEEGSIPFAPRSTSAPSLIQSTLGGGKGNFEVAVREDDNRLRTYVRLRDDEGPLFWELVGLVEPAENVTSGPSLIQSNLGPQQDNFELVVREGDKVRHYFRERISTDPERFEWRFGGDVTQ